MNNYYSPSKGFQREFNEQLVKGEQGEALFEKFLTSKGSTFTNVAKVPEFQGKEIDYLVTHANGASTTVEVKTDSRGHKTGNLFCELMSNLDRGREGWARTSEAEVLAYYFIHGCPPGSQSNLFFVNMAKLKYHLYKMNGGYRKVGISDSGWREGTQKRNSAVLLNWRELRKNHLLISEYNWSSENV